MGLSSLALAEKNRTASRNVWLVLLEITIPGVSAPLRVARNTEDVIWRGQVWTAFPFELEEICETAKGEAPRVEIKVGNANRVMESYLLAYDEHCKRNGHAPIRVEIMVVNSGGLHLEEPEVSHHFELIQPRTDSRWATFILGASNPFSRRFPRNRILCGYCRHVFKGERCGYRGGQTSCDKTLVRCRQLGNSVRFGGFPGAGGRGIRLG